MYKLVYVLVREPMRHIIRNYDSFEEVVADLQRMPPVLTAVIMAKAI